MYESQPDPIKRFHPPILAVMAFGPHTDQGHDRRLIIEPAHAGHPQDTIEFVGEWQRSAVRQAVQARAAHYLEQLAPHITQRAITTGREDHPESAPPASGHQLAA